MAHRIGVLLSGNGVYDGSEIHESVFTLLAIDENRGEAVCMAPNIEQHHVVNHISGVEMPEKRNVLIEAAFNTNFTVYLFFGLNFFFGVCVS